VVQRRARRPARLFAAYAAEKEAQRVLDFDDLLVWWAAALAEPALQAAMAARFDHVLVDEYQDTNRLQAAILRGLKPDGRGLTVVGDDAQSIYSFRAAEVRNILDFAAGFSPPAEVVASSATTARPRRCSPRRTRSSRSPPSATPRSCGATWRRSSRRRSVWVAGESEQAAWVADRTLALRETGLALKSQAVLFAPASTAPRSSSSWPGATFPFVKYGGLKFLEAAHVKDVLAVLRFAANPRGERAPGGRCSSCRHRRGDAGRLIAQMAAAADPPRRCRPSSPRPPRAGVGEFAALFATLRAPGARGPTTSPRSSAGTGRSSIGCTTTRRRAPPTSRTSVRLASGYVSRERFLTELALDPPAATSDESGPGGPRRGLPDPLDDPFGEGPGVERGLGAQRRRRLHPVRHGDRQRRRDRGGAAAALRRDDARPPSPAPARAAALLRQPAVGWGDRHCTRRSAASSRGDPRPLRPPRRGGACRSRRGFFSTASCRYRGPRSGRLALAPAIVVEEGHGAEQGAPPPRSIRHRIRLRKRKRQHRNGPMLPP
jgi:hypothetical protein